MNDMSSLHLLGQIATACSQPAPVLDAEGTGAWYVRRAGLFDEPWYLARNGDIAVAGIDPVQHFLDQGWREARNPNLYFDIDFYLAQNPTVAASGINPLLHYILAGEAQGLAPSAMFEPAWYAARQMLPPAQSPLAHFLANRVGGDFSPIPEFDAAFYRARNPDLTRAMIDPFEHYLGFGYREGRDPSESFDTKFYLHRYLGGDLAQNPLLHWRQFRHVLALQTQMPPDEGSVFEQARRCARPGPDFEEVQPLPRGATRQARVLAYYLPQFHEVAENNAWWGRGFTEWTAIARGMPRFEGHYQPRIPRDLGCYNLTDPDVMRRQAEMARAAGVHGFVHYFYWFNGRRLLESPVEAMLADPSIDMPFCLMWANENWTRRWDGSEQEILISQDYREDDDSALLATFARHFADSRYIRIGGRPVLMIYRAAIIPDCAGTLARWRARFRAEFNEDPLLVMAQSFNDLDPTGHGFDGAIEFPPHKLTSELRARNQQTRLYDPAMRGQIYAYDDLTQASLAEPAPGYPLIKTALPGWDNDARREGQGMALIGSTPAKYQAWLAALIERTATERFHGERIVCVNAWNEWAEGAYLEPDVHYGAAYLNATGRAVALLPSVERRERMLLVGHDAFPAGAQMLLLHIGRQLMAAHGVEIEFLLLGDGKLLPQYAELATAHVVADHASLAVQIEAARKRGVTRALVNTSVAARTVAALDRAGIAAVLLVHELPRVMAQYGMLPGLRSGAALAQRVIFPAACVRDAFPLALAKGQSRLLPQGLYKPIAHDPNARLRTRMQLGVPEEAALVLGAGYGDMRKGLDLFLQTARQAWKHPDGAALHFCWVGEVAPELSTYLALEIEAAMATGLGHFPGFQDDMAGFMNAADVFALTSREDPFPSVALEALASGIKVVAFAGTGGIADLLADADLGASVAMSDCAAMAAALIPLASPLPPDARNMRAVAARARFDFSAYAAEVLGELRQDAPRISVAVLSHNYARYLPERLGSIFAQTHPVEEVLVLDDASTDASVAVATATAEAWRRVVRLDVSARNSGRVFAQWQRAAALARGEYLWIAEADDAADPAMLARLARLLATHRDIDLAFCDSRAIDAQGETVMPDYKEYYRQSAVETLLEDGVFGAHEFLRTCLAERNTILNASAVLFRTEALRAALARCGDELASWRVAGDWRVYVEILAANTGRVAYLAAPLNRHRRHGESVTAKLPPRGMQAEIARMHSTINAVLTPDRALKQRQAGYRRAVREAG